MLYTVRFVAMLLLVLATVGPAHAFEDPTQGQPFFPWLWNDQIKPTAREALDTDGFVILFGTSIATITARQYDTEVRAVYGDNLRMSRDLSAVGSVLGNGGPGVATAVGLLLLDQTEGLKMARTLIFTSVSHFTIATVAGRSRPNNGPRSFPSGHTSTSFAVAGSLAYSYGPWVGVPALALATFVGATRIADNAHWLSDTVAAAGLGLFWARASADAGLAKGSVLSSLSPGLVPGGFTVNFQRDF